MRVVLEIITDNHKGRRKTFGAGQSLEIGRSEWTDFSCSWDTAMSSKHFRLETDQVGCLLVDLGSSNGTRVNQQPVAKALLRDGDEIEAGQTRFRVALSGGAPAKAAVLHASSYVETPSRPEVLHGLRGKLSGAFTTRELPSGRYLYTGQSEEVSPVVLADLLARNQPLSLLLDTHRAGLALEGATPPNYVFDFLPADAQAAVSPMLLTAAQHADWPAHLEEAWGQDAVVCLFTKLPQVELLTALRAASRGRKEGAVHGLCWPSILAALLFALDAPHLPPFLADVPILLLESPDNPDHWLIISTTDLTKTLKTYGLHPTPPPETNVPGS